MYHIEKNEKGKWVAITDIRGYAETSPPKITRKAAQAWLDEKELDSKVGDEGQRLMSAAIVKGIIEKKDGTSYFGSTMNYTYHFENAVKFGLVTKEKKVTKRGKEWYGRCLKHLSQKRQVNWHSEGGVGLPNHNIIN